MPDRKDERFFRQFCQTRRPAFAPADVRAGIMAIAAHASTLAIKCVGRRRDVPRQANIQYAFVERRDLLTRDAFHAFAYALPDRTGGTAKRYAIPPE